MSTKVTPGLYVGSALASGLIALALATLPANASTVHATKAVDVQVFDILRNGDPVGVHEVRKEIRDDRTTVRVKSEIAVRFLGLTVYRFEYTSSEIWDDDGLKSLDVEVDNNGKKTAFDGRRDGAKFAWSDGFTTATHSLPLFPTNHWSKAVLEQEKVLNTLTGEVDSVNIVEKGREMIRLPGSTIAATRYRYNGELDLESWYDDRGRWVAMRFVGDDGSTIEYLCRDCKLGKMM